MNKRRNSARPMLVMLAVTAAVVQFGASAAEAGAADRRLADGEAAPLTGIPLAMKDIFNTCGVPTTCASKILA